MSDPTPEQRADYLVRKLEQLIRDGRTVRGMSFKTWQALARTELINAFGDIERRKGEARQDRLARRLLIVAATTLTTIGFWGGAVAIDRNREGIAALVIFVSGLVLVAFVSDFGLRKLWGRHKVGRREKSIAKIEDFDGQLKKLENELWLKLKKAKEKAKEAEEFDA